MKQEKTKKKCGCRCATRNSSLAPIDTKLQPIAPHQSALTDKTEFIPHNIEMTSNNDGVSKYYLDGKEISGKEYLEWVERYLDFLNYE
jgi:hypothetical protein